MVYFYPYYYRSQCAYLFQLVASNRSSEICFPSHVTSSVYLVSQHQISVLLLVVCNHCRLLICAVISSHSTIAHRKSVLSLRFVEWSITRLLLISTSEYHYPRFRNDGNTAHPNRSTVSGPTLLPHASEVFLIVIFLGIRSGNRLACERDVCKVLSWTCIVMLTSSNLWKMRSGCYYISLSAMLVYCRPIGRSHNRGERSSFPINQASQLRFNRLFSDRRHLIVDLLKRVVNLGLRSPKLGTLLLCYYSVIHNCQWSWHANI